jgi:hypothetical protein
MYNLHSSNIQEFRTPLVGIYRNKGVQQVINEVLFKTKTDEGIRWPEYYHPFSIAGYALALTAVGVLWCHETILTIID